MAEKTMHIREVVRLADLVVASPRLVDHRFEDCLIIGPAVLGTINGATIEECNFDGEADEILWVIEPHRAFIVGSIEVVQCEFLRCRFSMVGFAGDNSFIQAFKEGMA